MATQRRYKGITSRKVVTLALVVIAFLLIIIYTRSNFLEAENEEYVQQKQELTAKIEDENQRSKELETYGQYVQTDEFVEWTARTKLGLVNKDELILRKNETK